jgi:glycerol uptake facilitator-like aquaporin
VLTQRFIAHAHPHTHTHGSLTQIAVSITAPVSAHLNPAVTLAIYMYDRSFSFGRLLQLWLAQVVGAFMGAAVLFGERHAITRSFLFSAYSSRTNPPLLVCVQLAHE